SSRAKPPDTRASCICANDAAFPRRAPRASLLAGANNRFRIHRQARPCRSISTPAKLSQSSRRERRMIISRTPLRMSFVGGGSDLPSYYREYGGAVVSTAIDKYVYVTMNRKFDSGIRVAYSRVEEVNSVSEIEHQLVRAALNMAGVPGGVEITTV